MVLEYLLLEVILFFPFFSHPTLRLSHTIKCILIDDTASFARENIRLILLGAVKQEKIIQRVWRRCY